MTPFHYFSRHVSIHWKASTTKHIRNCVNLNTCTHNYVISDAAGTIYWLCCGGEQQTRGRPLPLVLLCNGVLREELSPSHTHAQNTHTQYAHSKTKVHTLYRHSHKCLHASRQPKTGTFSPVSRYSTLSDSKRGIPSPIRQHGFESCRQCQYSTIWCLYNTHMTNGRLETISKDLILWVSPFKDVSLWTVIQV